MIDPVGTGQTGMAGGEIGMTGQTMTGNAVAVMTMVGAVLQVNHATALATGTVIFAILSLYCFLLATLSLGTTIRCCFPPAQKFWHS